MSFFGQPQQQATGGGLFSSPLGNKSAGGLFGGTTSAFPTTTTTGAATSTMFGGVQQPQASTSGSLFGPKPAGTSMFGAAATNQQPTGGLFGQQQQQQPAATGGFTSAASGGLFGGAKPATSAFGQVSQPTMFGQQAQQQPTIGGGGLFGTAAPAAGAFGTTTTSTPSLFGTGTAPSIGTFGQQQQPQQTQQGVGGLFGGAQSAAQPTFATFGAGGQTGTNVVKFAPPTGSDTMQLKGTQQQVTTKQMCISGMKEYESKSIEELRVGDYLAGRKVNMNAPQAVGAAGTSMFGQPQQQQQTTGGSLFKPGIFGGTTSAFPTTTTTGATSTMFGSLQQPSTSGSMFGKPAGTTMFGPAATTQQPTGGSLFQPATSAFGTGGGMFGKPATSAFGQVSQPTMFGQPAQQQQAGGIFGQATATGAFGAATTTTTNIFGTGTTPSLGFGQQQQQAQQQFGAGGGIFGQQKPGQPTFGAFSAGGQQQQQPFGATPSTGMFGAAAPKLGGGLFSQPLQQQQQPLGGSLFQKPAQTTMFGAPQQQQQLGTGLFGQATSYQQQPSFGSPAAPAMMGGMGMGAGSPPIMLGSNVNVASIQQAIIDAQLSTLPYGDSPLLKSPVSPKRSPQEYSSLQRQMQLSTTTTTSKALQEHLLSTTTSPFPPTSLSLTMNGTAAPNGVGTLTTTPTSQAELSAAAAQPSADTSAALLLNGSGSSSLSASLLDTSYGYKPLVLLPSVGFGAALGLHHSPKLIKSKSFEKSLLSDKSISLTLPEEERNIKSLDMSKLLEPQREFESFHLAPETPDQIAGAAEVTPLPTRTEKRPPTPHAMRGPTPPKPQFEQETPPSFQHQQQQPTSGRPSPTATPQQQRQQQLQREQQQQQQQRERAEVEVVSPTAQSAPTTTTVPEGRKHRVKLTRPEYYTEPSLDELDELFTPDGRCRLESGLTVGRLGYGSIFWKGPVELQGPVDLDEIVHFRNKEVVVYPDESKKPDIGEGLNRPAEVSLERVWPIDPTSREAIKDADDLRRIGFREKLERLSQRMDATFRDYQPATGTWQFEVQHFSKYGFLDEDDDDSSSSAALVDTSASEAVRNMEKQAHLQALVQKAKVPLREIQKTLEGTTAAQKKQILQLHENGAGELSSTAKRMFMDEGSGMDEEDSRHAELMDFDEDSKLFQEEIIRKKFKFDDTLFESSKLLSMVTEKEAAETGRTLLLKQRPRLVERAPRSVFKGLPAMNATNSMLAKACIQLRLPSCRVGFTEGLIVTLVAPKSHQNVVNIYQARVVPTVKSYFLHFFNSTIPKTDQPKVQQQLKNSSRLICFDPPSALLRFLDDFIVSCHHQGQGHCLETAMPELFSILLMDTTGSSQEEKLAQRIRMGQWLRAQLANLNSDKNAARQPQQQQQQSVFTTVFQQLVNGRVHKAIDAARQAHHYNLCLLLALYKTTVTQAVREQMAKQLATMNPRSSDGDCVKIFQLLAGEWTKGRGGCMDGLNWLQVLGNLIWYHAAPTTTLTECVEALEDLMAK